MKTFVSSLVLLGSLAGLDTGLVPAAEPSSLRAGKLLLLKNDYAMEGDIERIGDRYRVRRANGETWVPADRVTYVAASLPDAYAYLRRRINLDDPDERLRLARWCKLNGLAQQALTELKAAANLRPDHAETCRLLQRWQQETTTPPSAKPTAPLPSLPEKDGLPPVEVTSESLGLFATRVQPILMNTCARCHATGHGGKFQLTQAFADTVGNRRTLEHNLAAVLAQVDLRQPEASRLLSKAISDHAHTGQPPLRDRQATPYRTLENWIKVTVANNPHLLDALPPAKPAPPTLSSLFPPPPAEEKGRKTSSAEPSRWGADAHPSAAPAVPGPSSPTPAKSAAESTPAAPVDPYDPEPFNRKAHPEATPKNER